MGDMLNFSELPSLICKMGLRRYLLHSADMKRKWNSRIEKAFCNGKNITDRVFKFFWIMLQGPSTELWSYWYWLWVREAF